MIEPMSWTERVFRLDYPVGAFPAVLERFRGTPGRIDEMVGTVPPPILTIRIDDRWSIQEHVGHLFDLEELGERRLDEYLAGAATLSPADMSNRRTHEADHNARAIGNLAGGFREARAGLVDRLEELDAGEVARTARHPRLDAPMRVVDWVAFMCEHDDHHLAWMRYLFTRLRGG